ncbi:hypothetical protein [Dictyobacter arantiisoli]|uniref:hypothetical protein n=1 Tax=Dictyobacter arantiisoli TaxID=2014874 RepID=UPI0011EDFC20|nr:hypothetical protein [Dictyobacter arantiisoli]
MAKQEGNNPNLLQRASTRTLSCRTPALRRSPGRYDCAAHATICHDLPRSVPTATRQAGGTHPEPKRHPDGDHGIVNVFVGTEIIAEL